MWHNKLVEDTANNNFDHVGTLKYINILLHIDIYLQRVKYIINEQSMNINVFLLFCSFVFHQLVWERERVYKIGYKEKRSQVYLPFFRLSSCGEYFLFYGLIDFMLFLILAWRKMAPFVSEIFFSSSFTRSTWLLVPSATNPVQQLTFLILFFADGKKVPLPF